MHQDPYESQTEILEIICLFQQKHLTVLPTNVQKLKIIWGLWRLDDIQRGLNCHSHETTPSD